MKEMAAAAKKASDEQRAKMQEVTWGFGEDAKEEVDAAEHLLDGLGHIDPSKINDDKLTDKQRKALQLLLQKQTKIKNLIAQKEKLEAPPPQKMGLDAFEDAPPPPPKDQKQIDNLNTKINKLEDEVEGQLESMLVSLGYRNPKESLKERRRRQSFYETMQLDEEVLDGDKGPTEDYSDVPRVEGTETHASLTK